MCKEKTRRIPAIDRKPIACNDFWQKLFPLPARFPLGQIDSSLENKGNRHSANSDEIRISLIS